MGPNRVQKTTAEGKSPPQMSPLPSLLCDYTFPRHSSRAETPQSPLQLLPCQLNIWELDSMIPTGPFRLGMFCGSVIKSSALLQAR